MHPQKSFQSNQYNDNYIQTTNYKNKLKVSFRRNNLSKKDFILDERSRMYSISCQYTFKDASIDAKLSVPADKWDAFLDSKVCTKSTHGFGIRIDIDVPTLGYRAMQCGAIPSIIKQPAQSFHDSYRYSATVMIEKHSFLCKISYHDPTIPIKAKSGKIDRTIYCTNYSRPYQGGRCTPK
jgi:hypothetical protein